MANPGTELASLDFGNLIGGPLVAVIKSQSLAAEATAKFIKDVGFYPDVVASDGTTTIGTPVYVDFKYPKEIAPYVPGVGNPGDSQLQPFVAGKATVLGISITAMDSSRKVLTGTNFRVDWAGRTVTAQSHVISEGTKIVSVVPDGTSMTLDTAILGNLETATIALDAVQAIGDSNFPEGRPAYVAPISAQYQEMTISVPILTMLPIPFIKVDIITIDFNAKINSMETATTNTEAAVSGTLNARYGGKFTPASVSFSGSASYKKSTTTGSSVERTYSMAIHVRASQDEMPAGMEKLLNLLEGAMISTPGAITSGS